MRVITDITVSGFGEKNRGVVTELLMVYSLYGYDEDLYCYACSFFENKQETHAILIN